MPGYYLDMASTPSTALATLPSAFAAACRLSRTEGELFERCRVALVAPVPERTDLVDPGLRRRSRSRASARPTGSRMPQEVARLGSGETEVVIHADPTVAGDMRAVAMPLALGLSVVLELRSILLERQAALDDAVFQLRALRQVARLLSSVHSIEETEQLILDFMAEVFFAWWACLYRPEGERLRPQGVPRRSTTGSAPPRSTRATLDRALPPGSAATGADDVGGGRAGRARGGAGGAAGRRRRADGGAGARAPGSATSCTAGPSWSWRARSRSRRPSRSRTPSWWSSCTAPRPPTSSPASTTGGRSRSGSRPRSRAASGTSSTPARC